MNKKMLAGTVFVLLVCTAMKSFLGDTYGRFAVSATPVGGMLSIFPIIDSAAILLLGVVGVTAYSYWAHKMATARREVSAVLSSVPGGLCKLEWEPNLTAIYYNRGMTTLLQLPPHETLTAPIFMMDYIDRQDLGRVCSIIKGAYAAGSERYEMELRLAPKGGTPVWVLVRGSFCVEEGKTVTYWIVTDITTLKQNELKHKSTSEHLQLAVELTDEIVFSYDPKKNELHFTPKTAQKYGFPNVVTDIESFFSESGMFYGEDTNRLMNALALLRDGEPRVDLSFRMNWDTNTVRWYDARILNVLDDDGRSQQIIGIIKEITGIKNLELDRRYKSLMVSDCICAFEANITKDWLAGECHQGIETGYGSSYSEFTERVAKGNVHPDDYAAYTQKFSIESILDDFHEGRFRSYFEYRIKQKTTCGNDMMIWVLATVILTKDQTGDIRMFCYVNDIDEQKKREFYLLEQKKYHDAVLADTMGSFEADLTNDQLLEGYDDWLEGIGTDTFGSYSNMIKLYAGYKIHHEDADLFLNALLPGSAIEAYRSNQTDITVEYRCPDNLGNLIWVSCTVHLIEDKYTNSIKCFGYIKDINNKKLKELSLEYKAQRDDLSGMYNKSATENLISEYLDNPQSKGKTHALLMIDLDNFKMINDSQGHIFGDWVLSNISMQIRGLFRTSDIVGRVGGDEFVVFIKNIVHENVVTQKCAQLSKAINSTYHSESGECSVTGSIGVALYPNHGTTFRELYRKADSALYESKGGGKNMYTLYEDFDIVGKVRESLL